MTQIEERTISLAHIANTLEQRRLARAQQEAAIQTEATFDQQLLAQLTALAIKKTDTPLLHALISIATANNTGRSETAALFDNQDGSSDGFPFAPLSNEYQHLLAALLDSANSKTKEITSLPKKTKSTPRIQRAKNENFNHTTTERAPLAQSYAEDHPAFAQLLDLAKPPHVYVNPEGERYINPRLLLSVFTRTDDREFEPEIARPWFSANFYEWIDRYHVKLLNLNNKRKTGYISEADAVRFLSEIEYEAVQNNRHRYTIRITPFDSEEIDILKQWLTSGKLNKKKNPNTHQG